MSLLFKMILFLKACLKILLEGLLLNCMAYLDMGQAVHKKSVGWENLNVAYKKDFDKVMC